MLDPGFSMVEASKEVVKEHRDAFGTPREILQREVLRAVAGAADAARTCEAIAGQLRAGASLCGTSVTPGETGTIVDEWIDRTVLAVIGSAGAISSAPSC